MFDIKEKAARKIEEIQRINREKSMAKIKELTIEHGGQKTGKKEYKSKGRVVESKLKAKRE